MSSNDSSKQRPLDSGRKDALGRTVRVSGDQVESRADAPAPPSGEGFDYADVASAADARDKAIEWQNWVSEANPSYGELSEAEAYFEGLAARFGLHDEFAENGLIAAPAPAPEVDLYALNDSVSQWAAEAGLDLSDEQLNDAVHAVARIAAGEPDEEPDGGVDLSLGLGRYMDDADRSAQEFTDRFGFTVEPEVHKHTGETVVTFVASDGSRFRVFEGGDQRDFVTEDGGSFSFVEMCAKAKPGSGALGEDGMASVAAWDSMTAVMSDVDAIRAEFGASGMRRYQGRLAESGR